jgi:polysaccharide pyruvyl transferase WcaK-like protein
MEVANATTGAQHELKTSRKIPALRKAVMWVGGYSTLFAIGYARARHRSRPSGASLRLSSKQLSGRLILAGGWGHDNLGDEAILAGYLETLHSRRPVVLSVDPARTRASQRPLIANTIQFVDETSYPSVRRAALSSGAPLLISGGGFLNGSWAPEIAFRLRRLITVAARRRVVIHATELRRLDYWPVVRNARRLLEKSRVSVRDEKSAKVSENLSGVHAEVLPDSISLLFPHLASYEEPVRQLPGEFVLVNLQDVPRRQDSSEAEFDLHEWDAFCDGLVSDLGSRAVGISLGAEDAHYMRRFPNLQVIAPSSVPELVSLLRQASGLVSVRMHPALISTMLNRPTVSIPYCGKVRPTLRQVGLEDRVLSKLDLADVHARLSTPAPSAGPQWDSAAHQNIAWIEDALR